MIRKRLSSFLIAVTIVITGIILRNLSFVMPFWINAYAGDFLWAMAVYFSAAILLYKSKAWSIALASLLFCYFIEWTQLLDFVWLTELRKYVIIRWIIGVGFLWSDLIAYTLAIATSYLLDRHLLLKPQTVL